MMIRENDGKVEEQLRVMVRLAQVGPIDEASDVTKLIESLEIPRKTPRQDSPFLKVCLACGFSPLHLETFIAEHLQLLFPGKQVEVQTGLYGDLAGTLEQLDGPPVDASAIILEWSDLEPRLGIRRLGGGPGDLPDTLGTTPGSMRSFLAEFSGSAPQSGFRLSRKGFLTHSPPFFHNFWESADG